MATQKVSYFKFVPRISCDLNLVASSLLKENSDQNYFVINEQNDSYLAGCYLIHQARNEVRYNLQENKFETVKTSRLAIVRFEIDLCQSILTIWGNKSVAQRLITLLSIACSNQVIIENYQVEFQKIVKRISMLDSITFSKMKLENVMIDSGISASCIVPLLHVDHPKSLVKKYAENISQISLILGNSLSENAVSLSLFSTGSIVIYKDRDDLTEEVAVQIQEIALGRGDE